ncbi:hypothetical protein D3C72_1874540 [compost metagenome]
MFSRNFSGIVQGSNTAGIALFNPRNCLRCLLACGLGGVGRILRRVADLTNALHDLAEIGIDLLERSPVFVTGPVIGRLPKINGIECLHTCQGTNFCLNVTDNVNQLPPRGTGR